MNRSRRHAYNACLRHPADRERSQSPGSPFLGPATTHLTRRSSGLLATISGENSLRLLRPKAAELDCVLNMRRDGTATCETCGLSLNGKTWKSQPARLAATKSRRYGETGKGSIRAEPTLFGTWSSTNARTAAKSSTVAKPCAVLKRNPLPSGNHQLKGSQRSFTGPNRSVNPTAHTTGGGLRWGVYHL